MGPGQTEKRMAYRVHKLQMRVDGHLMKMIHQNMTPSDANSHSSLGKYGTIRKEFRRYSDELFTLDIFYNGDGCCSRLPLRFDICGMGSLFSDTISLMISSLSSWSLCKTGRKLRSCRERNRAISRWSEFWPIRISLCRFRTADGCSTTCWSCKFEKTIWPSQLLVDKPFFSKAQSWSSWSRRKI